METLEASVSLNFPHRQTPAYLSMHSLTTAKFPSPIVLPTLYRSVIVAGIWKPSSDSSERIISVFLLIEKEAQTTKDTFLRITSQTGINSEALWAAPSPAGSYRLHGF